MLHCAGYCQITCGRCNCCGSYLEVLSNASLSTLGAVAAAAGMKDTLSDLSTMLTLLAPSDEAFEAALPALGRHFCILECVRQLQVPCITSQGQPLLHQQPS